MNATPAQPSHDRPGRRWVSIAAGGALTCALVPLLALLSIVPWSSLITLGPYAAIILTIVALRATRHRPVPRGQGLMVDLALAVLCLWMLLFVVWGLALLYA